MWYLDFENLIGVPPAISGKIEHGKIFLKKFNWHQGSLFLWSTGFGV